MGKSVTLYFEVKRGAEQVKEQALRASETFKCPVTIKIISGSPPSLEIGFQENIEERTIFYFCTRLKNLDHPILRCVVKGCDSYTEQKIQTFFG